MYIRSAKRTPIGALSGSLSSIPAPKLAASSITATLSESNTPASEVDECYIGNVLSAGIGQAPARQAALAAGIPESTPCTTISKVCGSGMQAIISAARAIKSGEIKTAVVGGMENMSQVPHLLPTMRNGVKLGNSEIIDSMIHDGLWDPYNDQHMGMCGEECATNYQFSRKDQDDFAITSYQRAQAAISNGDFKSEIAPVTHNTRKGTVTIDTDESPAQVNFDKLPTLRSVFKKDGTITAANASSINDGAAALVISSEPSNNDLGKIVGWSTHAREPINFTTAPIGAIQTLLDKTGWSADSIDLWEINEAFAVVPLAVIKDLKLDPNKVNINGGAIALGHPIGASGARIVVTLAHAMKHHQAKRGIAAICIGGGEALAIGIERD